MAVQDGTAERLPPYVSFRTFQTFVNDLREQGIPPRIDRSVWESHFSGSVGTQLMVGLRFLGLLKEGDEPTPKLRALVDARQPEAWRAALADVLRAAYGPVIALPLKEVSPRQLRETFERNYPATDHVTRKCVSFFIHAAQDAGIEISARVLNRTRQSPKRRASSGGPQRRSTDSDRRDDSGPRHSQSPAQSTTTPEQMLIHLLDPEAMNDQEREAVFTLLLYLKKCGQKRHSP